MQASCLGAALAATIVLGSAAPALARSEGPPCGSFDVVIRQDARKYVDHGDEGASPGDQRLNRATLLDPEGNKLGDSYLVATMLPLKDGEDDYTVHSSTVSEFPNGTITAIGIARPKDPESEQAGIAHPVVWTVTGGTGAFVTARGTMTATTRDDGARALKVELTCD